MGKILRCQRKGKGSIFKMNLKKNSGSPKYIALNKNEKNKKFKGIITKFLFDRICHRPNLKVVCFRIRLKSMFQILDYPIMSYLLP